MLVKVSRAAGTRKSYAVEEGATVNDALGKAGIILSDKEEVFVNGERASRETLLHQNDKITVSNMVKGN